MPNIAVFHNLPTGGAKRVLFEFCRLLSSKGYNLDLYILTSSEERFFPLKGVMRNVYMFKAPERKRISGIRPYVMQYYLNLFREIKFQKELEKTCEEMAKTINSRGYDLAFVHHCRYMQSPYILRHLAIPSIYYCQEPFRRLYEPRLDRNEGDENRLSPRERLTSRVITLGESYHDRFLRTNDRLNARSAQRILVNSYYSRESIYRTYGILGEVNYLGIDTEVFRPLNIPKKNVVLSVGRIQYPKRHDFVVKSLALVPEEIRPGLNIIGDSVSDRELDYLKALSKKKGVSLEVRVLVSDDDLVKVYNEAKIVIYVPFMEPFGLVPLEAMACRTPVIGIKEGGVRETVIHNSTGILVDRDEEECALWITKLLKESELYSRLSNQAREYVCREWTWTRAIENLEKHIQRLVRKEP